MKRASTAAPEGSNKNVEMDSRFRSDSKAGESINFGTNGF